MLIIDKFNCNSFSIFIEILNYNIIPIICQTYLSLACMEKVVSVKSLRFDVDLSAVKYVYLLWILLYLHNIIDVLYITQSPELVFTLIIVCICIFIYFIYSNHISLANMVQCRQIHYQYL